MSGKCVGICKAKYKAAGYTPSQISGMKCICESKPSKKYDNKYIQFFEEKIVVDKNPQSVITGDIIVKAYHTYYISLGVEDPKTVIQSLPYNLDLIFNLNKHTPLKNYYEGKGTDIFGTTNIRDVRWKGVRL
jgi:hypothetical protein